MISGGDIGGAKTHVINLLQGLMKEIEVRLVCFREGPFAQEARDAGIDVVVIPDKNPFTALRKLKSEIEAGSFEIIHCHGAKANMMGAFLRREYHIPVISTVHSDYRLDYLGRPLGMISYGVINTITLRKKDYWIGVCDPIADMLSDRGYPADRLFTLYNGSNLKVGTDPFDKIQYFRSLGLTVEPGDVVGGIAARLSKVKDIPTLLRATERVCRKNPHFKLVIAGEGEKKEELIQLCRRLKLEDNVCFAGWLSDMDRFYRAIDINLLTSVSEAFPYVLPEGGRCGCATIASNVGGVPVIIIHGVTGLLFEPGDDETLSQHILLLMENSAVRKRLGEKLKEITLRDYSVEKMVAKQISIYQQIVEDYHVVREKRDTIVICGSYGRGNTGDDAILESILQGIRRERPHQHIRVLSRNPKETRKKFRVQTQHTFRPISMLFILKKCSLYISGGGSLIQNITSERTLLFYLFTIRMAKKMGCRVMMYGSGIGPVLGERFRKKAGKVLDQAVDVITVREEESIQELRDMNVTRPKICLAADPVFSLQSAGEDYIESFMLSNGIKADEKYICFALRSWPGFKTKASVLGEAAEYAQKKYGLKAIFIPMQQKDDVIASEIAAENISGDPLIIRQVPDSSVLLGVFSRMQIVVAMRLHALIFASIQNVPTVGIVYDEKVSAYLNYIQNDRYLLLEDLTVTSLKQLIDQAVCEGKENQELRNRIEILRKQEKTNTIEMMKLLEKE